LAVLLVVLPVMGLWPLPVQAAYVFSGGGVGTLDDPYIIQKAEELDRIRDNLTASYRLQADIDLSSYSNWEPIGTSTNVFRGNFDGAGYTIRGLKINSSADYIGLFGYVNLYPNKTIQHVRLENVNITSTNGNANVGGLAGVSAQGTIDGCLVTGQIHGEASAAGGLIGQFSSDGKLLNSASHVRLNMDKGETGGLIGATTSGAKIDQSYATGDVSNTGSGTTGGLVGYHQASSIVNSYATGDVTATGNSSVGRLLGLISDSGIVRNSYATGIVRSGTGSAGGLIGKEDFIFFPPVISNSYWNSSDNPSGLQTIGGKPGMDGAVHESVMKQMATYVGWDTVIWGIQEGETYPYLMLFSPVLKVDPLSPTYSTEPGVNQLTISGYVRDGSIGELLEVSYTIKDSSSVTIAQDVYAIRATGGDQAFQFSPLLDESLYTGGAYTIDLMVKDTVASHVQQQYLTFEVLDTTAPVITLLGSNPMEQEVGSVFADPGATALDAVDGNLTAQITVSGTVNTNKVGTYMLTYQVSDLSGNMASETRTVNVVDTGLPVITLLGSNPMELEVGSTFADPGATAMDAVDGNLTAQITVSGTVNTNKVGTYTLTYQVSDASGNMASDTRTVNVVDTGLPVITLLGSNPMELEVGSTFADPGATALDAVDGNLTAKVTVSGTVNTNKVGTYTLTYQVSDLSGNKASETRTVNVVDTDLPVITLLGSNPMELEVGSTFADPGATALDAVDGNLTAQITVSGTVNTNKVGTYTLTYQVRDLSGNAAVDAVRTVNVFRPSSEQYYMILSSNADLSSITIYSSDKQLALSPAFAPETTHYTAKTDAEQVELQVASSDSTAVVKLVDERIGKTKTFPLAMGDNVLAIQVQAQDGTVKTYTITINRTAQNENTTPSAPVCSFTDIEHHWAKADICEAARLWIVEGMNSQTFMPDAYVTRTEFAVMLLRALQIDVRNETVAMPFSDKTDIPVWARSAIQTAVAEGMLEGYSDGMLRPLQTVDRSEMAAMVSKTMKWEASSTDRSYFSDYASIPAWAKGYVEAAREHGLITGRAGNQFAPAAFTTRAEATVLLLRLWKIQH